MSETIKAASLRGATILVAEDQLDSQDLIKRTLEQEGATVVTADDGAQSVTLALASHFDIILLDINMPELDGLGAAEVLRGRGIKAPMIALSAHDLPGDVFNARVAGFTAHVSKPFEKTHLISTILEHWNASKV